MTITVNVYDHFLEILGDGSIDMDTDTFKIALMDSSHVFAVANTTWADVSANEIANGNGYTTGGAALTSVTWGQVSGTVTFDFANTQWTASGGSISATDAVIYDDTSGTDLLICSIDFGGTETAEAGATFSINVNASGLFAIAEV